jgi:hypothetical protein
MTELKERVKRWNRCVEVEGDYIEKWYWFRFCIFTVNVLFFLKSLYLLTYSRIKQITSKIKQSSKSQNPLNLFPMLFFEFILNKFRIMWLEYTHKCEAMTVCSVCQKRG